MIQLPVIVVLVVSLFVSQVSPVSQEDGHEKSKVDLPVNLKGATNNTSSNSNSKAAELLIKATDDKKGLEKTNEINNVSTSSKDPVKANTTKPTESTKPSETNVQKSVKNAKSAEDNPQKPIENENQNCTFKTEQADMLKCHVTPHDNDDLIEKNLPLNATEPTITNTTAANNKTETNEKSQITKTIPPKDKEDIETVMNVTHATDQVSYDVVPIETNHSTNTNHSDVSHTDSKNSTNTSEVPIVPPLLVDNVAANTGTEGIVGAVKSIDQVNKKHMPSGIIALVTAISFAVAIALVYIGMIVWRRYIEYRYGHRELLVNELEFDTNDLRHFEL